jgi:Fe-S-cluster containining protein
VLARRWLHRGADAVTAVRTFGEYVVAEGVVDWITAATRHVNDGVTATVIRIGKKSRPPRPSSCIGCTAAKGCCSLIQIAHLHEGVPIAARLRAEGRDTPELRDRLRETADAMTAADRDEWRRPCVFLDDAERCTIYSDRPTACGTLFVYSPAERCADRAASDEIEVHDISVEISAVVQFAEAFRRRLGLRRKVGRMYVDVLPRIVLRCLEAWDRTDYHDYFRLQTWPEMSD